MNIVYPKMLVNSSFVTVRNVLNVTLTQPFWQRERVC